MFIITHDLEAALVCDRTAILREGRLLEFDSPQNLISSLPGNGLLIRLSIKDFDEEKIEIIRRFSHTQKVVRVGNLEVEVFLDNFEKFLPDLMKYLFNNGINVISMSKDLANFRRFFQIRISEEEEKERKNHLNN
ncbi:MAG: hypothetical protein P8Y70_04515 [Candidatus Lokiarchaeota archaeon]